jgi:heme A synthase
MDFSGQCVVILTTCLCAWDLESPVSSLQVTEMLIIGVSCFQAATGWILVSTPVSGSAVDVRLSPHMQ